MNSLCTFHVKCKEILNNKAQKSAKTEFANTVNPDETAYNEPSQLVLQCLSSFL